MKPTAKTYTNGQQISVQEGDMLTYYFEDGAVKAKGKQIDGIMQGEWIFNKKEGYLWQVGNFDNQGDKHGSWIVYNKDGSVQSEKQFEHGVQVKL